MPSYHSSVSDKQKQHLSQTLTENYGQLEPRRPHLSRPAATGGAQEPQMVTERRAGQHRCRTLPPSRKALLDGTVPDPDGSSAAQHVPAVVGGESRQCPPAAARRWWHSAASRPTPPTSARERLNPTVSLSPREHEGRCLRDNMNLSGTGLGGVWMWAQVRACTSRVCMWGSVCKPAVACVGLWGSTCSRVYVGGVVYTMCV
ncbi:uncharacterized protein [Macaca nemestrina]|uniref:uncharacterized protein isoform X1 n=1 Tax=Macaca nemestrina TaxID=9545 RepID=UPI0039B9AD7F